MNNFNNKKIYRQKGFTIIETLVAIFVLLISTTGPLTFAQSGLRSSFLARDQITAFYLAQSSVEILKNIRDTTSLYNRTRSSSDKVHWLSDFGVCRPGVLGESVGESVTCNFDDTQAVSCDGGDCPNPLFFDPNTKKFNISSGSGGVPSKYIRTVYVTELVEGKEAQVIVKVEWDSNFFSTRRIIIQENIYNI